MYVAGAYKYEGTLAQCQSVSVYEMVCLTVKKKKKLKIIVIVRSEIFGITMNVSVRDACFAVNKAIRRKQFGFHRFSSFPLNITIP